MRSICLVFVLGCATAKPHAATVEDIPNHIELVVGQVKVFPRRADSVKDAQAIGAHFDTRYAPDGVHILLVGKASGRDRMIWILPDGSQEVWTIDVYNP